MEIAQAKWMLALGTIFCALASDAQVSWSVDNTEIQWGERVILTANWTLSDDEQARGLGAPESWPAWSDTTAGGFEILRHGDISIAAKPSGDKELTTLQKDWTITSWDTGFVSIPSTPFGDDIAPSIQIYVEAPDFDTIPQDSLLQHLPAPAGIVELEFTMWEIILRNWYWWLSIIALFVILYVLYRKYDKLRRVSTFGLSPLKVRHPSSLAWAINSLDTILLNQPWKHAKAKEAHVEASLAIRRFIEDHYKIRATESTTKELQFLMNGSAVPAEWQQRLIQLINQSDIIKYAKGELPDSTHQSMFESYRDFLSYHESISKHEE